MRRTKLTLDKLHGTNFLLGVVAILWMGGFSIPCMAPATGPEDIFISGRRKQRARHFNSE